MPSLRYSLLQYYQSLLNIYFLHHITSLIILLSDWRFTECKMSISRIAIHRAARFSIPSHQQAQHVIVYLLISFFLLLVDQYELENIQLLLSIMCKSHNSLTTHMSHNKDLQLTVLTLYKTSHKFLPTFLKLFVKNVKTDLPIHSFISYPYSIYMKNNA